MDESERNNVYFLMLFYLSIVPVVHLLRGEIVLLQIVDNIYVAYSKTMTEAFRRRCFLFITQVDDKIFP